MLLPGSTKFCCRTDVYRRSPTSLTRTATGPKLNTVQLDRERPPLQVSALRRSYSLPYHRSHLRQWNRCPVSASLSEHNERAVTILLFAKLKIRMEIKKETTTSTRWMLNNSMCLDPTRLSSNGAREGLALWRLIHLRPEEQAKAFNPATAVTTNDPAAFDSTRPTNLGGPAGATNYLTLRHRDSRSSAENFKSLINSYDVVTAYTLAFYSAPTLDLLSSSVDISPDKIAV